MLGRILSVVELALKLVNRLTRPKPKPQRGLTHADAERQSKAAREAGPPR